jgi:hypothetical protein
MIHPDLINVWPKDILYLPFIRRIKKDRHLFNQVITVISEGSPRHNYTEEIIKSIPDLTVLRPNMLELTAGGKDWRDVAVKEALGRVNSDYILFMEQDFLVEDGFFGKLFKKAEGLDAVGFEDHNRLHPACLLVKREALDKTSKDFAAYPPENDHFAIVTQQLMAMRCKTFQELGLDGWYHLASLTFNIRLDEEEKPVQYRPDEYKLYKLMSQLI